ETCEDGSENEVHARDGGQRTGIPETWAQHQGPRDHERDPAYDRNHQGDEEEGAARDGATDRGADFELDELEALVQHLDRRLGDPLDRFDEGWLVLAVLERRVGPRRQSFFCPWH